MTDQEVIRIGRPPRVARKRRGWRAVALAAVVAVALGGAAVVYVALRPSGFDINGKLMLPASGSSFKGVHCEGKGGYSDIGPGTQVVVTDPSGTIIATGSLGGGVGGTAGCELPFTITDVPAGLDFYGVEVAHRGRLQYDKTQIREPLTFTLGG